MSGDNGALADVQIYDLFRVAIAEMEKATEQGEEIPLGPVYEVEVQQKAPRGAWLTVELETYKRSKGITERQRSTSRDHSGQGSRDCRDGGSRGDRGDRSQKSSSRDR